MSDSDSEYRFVNTCKANGCPLPVDFVTHWHEPEKKGQRPRPKWGVCRFHKGADGSEWSAITKRILDAKRGLQMLHAVRSVTDTRLRPMSSETAEAWLSRVDTMLREQIRPEEKRGPKPVGVFESLQQQLSGQSSARS